MRLASSRSHPSHQDRPFSRRDKTVKTLAIVSRCGVEEYGGAGHVLEGEQINPIRRSPIAARLYPVGPSDLTGDGQFKTVAVGTTANGQSAGRKTLGLHNGRAVSHGHKGAVGNS